MPSNQRPLTRPSRSSIASGNSLVASAGRILTGFSLIFLVFSLSFSLRSPQSNRDTFANGSLYVKGLASSYGTKVEQFCHAMQVDGWVELKGDQSIPTWNTLSSICPTADVVASLVASTRTSEQESKLTRLQNKTILVVGDQKPNRRRMDALCPLLGGWSGGVDVRHPWGAILSKSSIDSQGYGLGTYCYLPKRDLLIHHFPIDAPGTAESLVRLETLLPSLLTAWSSRSPAFTSPSIPLPRRSSTPDLTIWSSYVQVEQWSKLASGSVPVNRDIVEEWSRGQLRGLNTLSRSLGARTMPLWWMAPGFGDGTEATSDKTVEVSMTVMMSASRQRRSFDTNTASLLLPRSVSLPPSSTRHSTIPLDVHPTYRCIPLFHSSV